MKVEPLITYFERFLPLDEEEKSFLEKVFKERKIRRRQYILQAGDSVHSVSSQSETWSKGKSPPKLLKAKKMRRRFQLYPKFLTFGIKLKHSSKTNRPLSL